jgi:succinate dehydrogenase / fumarate reductase flavoprotein subunit
MLDAKIPQGVPLDDKWTYYKGHCKLVNPANKRKLEIIVVGTGLAGASAAASLGELGYSVKAFVSRIHHGVHIASQRKGYQCSKELSE